MPEFSRRTIFAMAAVLACGTTFGQVGPIGSNESEPDCITAYIGEFPHGGPDPICVYELSDCTADPPYSGTIIFSSCGDEVCACIDEACDCEDGDDDDDMDMTPDSGGVPSSGGAPASGGGAAVPGQGPAGGGAAGPVQPMRINFKSNQKDIPWVVPVASRLVGSAANEITAFGRNGYKVKYLKVLRLSVNQDKQYFALFKIFKDGGDEDKGDAFESTDSYIGIRIGAPPSNVAGGFEDLSSATTTDFQKLAPFVSSDSAKPSYVREAAARLSIPSGASKPKTWFHLFGTVL